MPSRSVAAAPRNQAPVKLWMFDYSADTCVETQPADIADCLKPAPPGTVRWINIDGLHRADMLEQLAAYFNLHPLVLEDIQRTDLRPKLEDFEHYLFVVVKMLRWHDERHELDVEHVSLIITPHTVVSIQENIGDVFDPLRDRIRAGKGRVRKMDTGYLAYALLDAIVDEHFVVLENIGEMIEELEDSLISKPTPKTLRRIQQQRRIMINLRRSVWPLRDVLSTFERAESPLLSPAVAIYFRELHDHTVRVIETCETHREILSGMLDIYLSSVSYRMNEIMKVLAIIATIFMPLTFFVGVYGMNFKYMPELQQPWGYPAVWLVIVSTATGMIIYFKRRRWW